MGTQCLARSSQGGSCFLLVQTALLVFALLLAGGYCWMRWMLFRQTLKAKETLVHWLNVVHPLSVGEK